MLPDQERKGFVFAVLLALLTFGGLAFGSQAWMMAHAVGKASPGPTATVAVEASPQPATPAAAEAPPKPATPATAEATPEPAAPAAEATPPAAPAAEATPEPAAPAAEASPEPAAAEEKPKTEAKAEAEPQEGKCCPANDMTLPLELISKYPPGELHSPYQDYAELAKDKELVKQFRLPGCNECHGGGGGGGFCPALSQGVWFWGNTDDVLFRLIALGSKGLEAQGFVRYQFGSVPAPMPPMAVSIKSSDQLWKIIAFIRSINPPGTNPPEKVIPGKMAPPAEDKKG